MGTLSCLPPVGCRIEISPLKGMADFAELPGSVSLLKLDPVERVMRHACFYGSGTMALAQAMLIAKHHAESKYGVTAPEIILPAYGCPDIVSAALFAQIKPVLVDLEYDKPWMNLDLVQKSLTPETVAVVAAHFLGLSERLKFLRELTDSHGAILIEDSAQLFPTTATDEVWTGDLVALSFGRGKPVSILGGGALLCNQPELNKHLTNSQKWCDLTISHRFVNYNMLKVAVYNYMLRPRCYGLLQNFPFLKLGQTTFRPLHRIEQIASQSAALLPANLYAYLQRERLQENWINEAITTTRDQGEEQLKTFDNCKVTGIPLLRYPLLVESQSRRDNLLKEFIAAGLGVTSMYRAPISEIHGLVQLFKGKGPFPAARSFAQRLITLPCHTGVDQLHTQEMISILRRSPP